MRMLSNEELAFKTVFSVLDKEIIRERLRVNWPDGYSPESCPDLATLTLFETLLYDVYKYIYNEDFEG